MIIKELFFKVSIQYITISILFAVFETILFNSIGFNLTNLLIVNLTFFPLTVLSVVFTLKILLNRIREELKDKDDKKEQEFQNSIKNIYDEHIFSITHELRSPLSVISGNCLTQINNLKNLYKILEKEENLYKTTDIITNLKRSIQNVDNQVSHIESFIYSISEHGQLIDEKESNQSILSIQPYLINILINSHSFCRNMKVFKNNICFADIVGLDWENLHTLVNYHDLTRMIMNIMNNAADAVSSSYKEKMINQSNYEPSLKFRCIKSLKSSETIQLNKDFICLKKEKNPWCPVYLLIQDNGPGISPENINKICEYRFSTKSDKANYGLGLHIVMKLAEKNKLKLFVKTNSSGTVFAIGFPIIYFNDKNINSYMSDDCKYLINKYTIPKN